MADPLLRITKLEFRKDHDHPSGEWTIKANGQLLIFDGDGRLVMNGQVMSGAPGEPSFIRDGTAALMARVAAMHAAPDAGKK